MDMKTKRTFLQIETRRSVTFTAESTTGTIVCAACGPETKFLTTSEVALVSGCSESALKRAISQGLIHAQLLPAGDLSICAHSLAAMTEERHK